MFPSDLTTSAETLVVVALSTAGAYLALIAFSRMAGLRSFARMTNFDIAATVIVGSIAATAAVRTSVSLLQGVVSLAALFLLQALLAQLRRYRGGQRVVDNAPLLLMSGDQVLTQHLAAAEMTPNDLRSKLRLAGVGRIERVRAVVLETDGEVSVVAEHPDGPPVDVELFSSVRGYECLTSGHHGGARSTEPLGVNRASAGQA